MSSVASKVRRGVVGLVVALAVLLTAGGAPAGATPSRAASASCTVNPWDKSVVLKSADGVDAVLVARVAKAVRSAGPASAWSYTIRIVHTFRGSARPGNTATLTQVPVRRRAGVPLVRGATYLLFLHQAGAGFAAERCGGSVRLPRGLSRNLELKLTADLLGTGAPGGEVVYSAPTGGVRDVPSFARMAAPGVGFALVGVLGLLLVARLSRERS